tara:strand:+ start:2240 stop:2518 length:279 start_codon:yes stop_codon:yes gene_type:complete
MEIKQISEDRKGHFEAYVEDEKSGLMTYKWNGKNEIVIDHTEVHEGFEGKGIGKQLVLAGVAFARNNNLKIKPTCPFAKKFLERTSDYEDVL